MTANKMKPRVLFILHLPPPVHGASVMGAYIYDSKYINEAFESDFINLSSSISLNEIGKGALKKQYQILKIVLKVFKQLLKHKYDLVYITLTARGPGFYKDVSVVAIVKLFGKKITYHFHNKGISNTKNTALNRFLYKFAFANTKSILLSEYLYKDFSRYLKRDQVRFCANGIPPGETFNRNRNTSVEISKVVSFLFLSNMMEEKGVYVLLDACSELNEMGVEFKCEFVGAWSDIREDVFITQVMKRNLSDVVSYHGKKYDDEKNYFFNQADVFVFPTYYHNESFPVVILEAMQFSLPVISTFEGGIPGQIIDGETGFLVPQRDSIKLAAKMKSLIKDADLRMRMGAAGKKRFEMLFTKEKFEKNLTSILREEILTNKTVKTL